MQKLFLFLCLFIFSLVFSAKNVLAEENRISNNNKFGIHIIQAEDIPDAANLVNSSGGDWGYVTFVIQKDQRDVSRWQGVFDTLRRQHLIPIIRIATKPLDDVWEKPNLDEIKDWVSFLDSLNWVIKKRYIILGNEPNHAKEWGGKIDPLEYATWAEQFSTALKKSSDDYIVMAAGLDVAASNTKETMDALTFWRKIYLKQPSFFKAFDALSSHSYPNPGFSASEYKRGRNSITSYDWELLILKDFGSPDLPVFITETGWVHNADNPKIKNITPEKAAEKMKYAFENVWLKDDRVMAVTPFILNYAQPPFEKFSWKKPDNSYYPIYSIIQGISKIKGQPVQIDKAEILTHYTSPFILNRGRYSGFIITRNIGQSIWLDNEISLKTGSGNKIKIKSAKIDNLEPGNMALISFESQNEIEDNTKDSLFLVRNNQIISKEYNFEINVFKIAEVKVETFFDRILKLIRGL